MSWLYTLEVGSLLVMLVVVVPLTWLWLRRRWFSRQDVTFECGLRRLDRTPGTRWVLGVARFRGQELQWFPSFSLSLRPAKRFDRSTVAAGSQRRPTAVEAVALFDDQRILRLDAGHHAVELAMSQDALTALLSWLEASPPGLRYR